MKRPLLRLPRSVQSVWAPGGKREVDEAKARWAGGLPSFHSLRILSHTARPAAASMCTLCTLRLQPAPAPPPRWLSTCLAARRSLPPCRFAVAEGDLVSYLNVWRAWEAAGRSKKWAVAHRVMHRSLLRAADIRGQVGARLLVLPGAPLLPWPPRHARAAPLQRAPGRLRAASAASLAAGVHAGLTPRCLGSLPRAAASAPAAAGHQAGVGAGGVQQL